MRIMRKYAHLLGDVFVVGVDDVPLAVLVDDEEDVVRPRRLAHLRPHGHPHREEVRNVRSRPEMNS